jgi:2-keto-4-pentenoate hydratase/2-oxohepta-3-ene-1,7-dioic acid hydratase in catechol pathway
LKIASFAASGRNRYGLISDNGIIDLTHRLPAPTLAAAIADGLLNDAKQYERVAPDFSLADVELRPVIPEPKHIFCVGVNYRDHLQEVRDAGITRPKTTRPPIFTRYPETLVGHERPIVRPGVSSQFDYEAELAVIIGKNGRYIEREMALSHIAGYSCFNDGSMRDWQFHTTQIVPGKNFFQSGSFGPWMVTPEEVTDPHDLNLKLFLNGRELQSANTKDMIFDIESCISYVSALVPLLPGDVIATGTPGGVGFGRTPQLFMEDGDLCEVVIDKIGTLRNKIRCESSLSHWAV